MKYKAKEKKPKMMSECQIDTMIFIQTQFKSMLMFSALNTIKLLKWLAHKTYNARQSESCQ